MGWYEANTVVDLSRLNTLLLKDYRTFIRSLYPLVLDYKSRYQLDTVILEELISRCDLNSYEHKALNMIVICV